MTTYYVKTTGNDSNTGLGTTDGLAWLTVQKAANTISAGDIVNIMAGTYGGFTISSKSGTSGNWITFRPYQSDVVIIDSWSDEYASTGGVTYGWCIQVDGSTSYIEFNGFEITESNDELNGPTYAEYSLNGKAATHGAVRIKNTSNHIRVINCNIHDMGAGGSGTDQECHFNEFINNTVNNVGRSKRGYGLYWSGDDNIIRGNTFSNCYGQGINIWSSHTPKPDRNLIEDNISYDNGHSDYGAGWPGFPAEGVLYGCGIVCGSGGIDNIIQNNIIYGNLEDGIQITWGMDDTIVVNNTIYNNARRGIHMFAGAVNTVDGTIVRNNISYNNGITDYYEGAYVENTIQTNNLFGTDPSFVDAGSGNFHLQSGSGAIDTGISTNAPLVDFDGISRPQGDDFDIGAYEYVFGSIPQIIIDNGDSGTTFTGSWTISSGANPYGANSLYANATATYTYTANSINGNYNISMWWTWWANRCSSINIDIYDGYILLDTVQINQLDSDNAGKWNLFGTYAFTGTAIIKITSVGSCTTCADAVKISRGSAFKYYTTFANYRRCLLIR